MVFVAAIKARSSVGNLANTRAVADSNLERGRERERERERERLNHFQHAIILQVYNTYTCTYKCNVHTCMYHGYMHAQYIHV